MSNEAPSWVDQWGDSEEDVKQPKNEKKKMAEMKAAASAGMGKAKTAAVVGAQKVKTGTVVGFKWVKEQYQKRSSFKGDK